MTENTAPGTATVAFCTDAVEAAEKAHRRRGYRICGVVAYVDDDGAVWLCIAPERHDGDHVHKPRGHR